MPGAKHKRPEVLFKGEAPAWYRKQWNIAVSHIIAVAKVANVRVSKVEIHWHDDPARGKHCSLGEADSEGLTFCTNPSDEDTFIHEVAHLATPGQHGNQWAECYYMLLRHFMSEAKMVSSIAEAMKTYPSVRKLVRFVDAQES
tara:strand:+ start:17302 stop:17730 length:429 start_codon:yes stop_codon:yes gene_type:complete